MSPRSEWLTGLLADFFAGEYRFKHHVRNKIAERERF
jgi:hypothetical protein